MLGVRKECSISSGKLEVQQKYLKVRGVYNRKRDVATGKVLDKIKTNHTYSEGMNYWTSLDTINKVNETKEEINGTTQKHQKFRNNTVTDGQEG
jgi:hypothetical protein